MGAIRKEETMPLAATIAVVFTLFVLDGTGP